jgi:hypothetical protein
VVAVSLVNILKVAKSGYNAFLTSKIIRGGKFRL